MANFWLLHIFADTLNENIFHKIGSATHSYTVKNTPAKCVKIHVIWYQVQKCTQKLQIWASGEGGSSHDIDDDAAADDDGDAAAAAAAADDDDADDNDDQLQLIIMMIIKDRIFVAILSIRWRRSFPRDEGFLFIHQHCL